MALRGWVPYHLDLAVVDHLDLNECLLAYLGANTETVTLSIHRNYRG